MHFEGFLYSYDMDTNVLGSGLYGTVTTDGVYAYKRYKTAQSPLEATISKLMGNAGIGPKVYSVSENKGNTVIKMNKLDGVASEIDLSKQDQCDIKCLVSSLKKHGITHGDIHLDNIMYTIGKNGTKRFYIIDFGLARFRNTDSINTNNDAMFMNQLAHANHKAAKKAQPRVSNNQCTCRKSLF